MAVPQFDFTTANKVMHAFVPISRFNKGEAGKIIEEVKADGFRVVVKNNAPECVMLSMEEYHRLDEKNKPIVIPQPTKAEEEKRKAWIEQIRKNASPPIPAKADRKTVMDAIGSIDIDEESVLSLRELDRERFMTNWGQTT